MLLKPLRLWRTHLWSRPTSWPRLGLANIAGQQVLFQQEVVPKVPSLADLSVEPTVNHALEAGHIEALDLLLDIPGKAALIKEALRKRVPLPDDAIILVAKIISQEVRKSKQLDLSRWALTSEQVVRLVSQQRNIESLRLSHNHHVTKTTVLEVLSSQPTLRKLVLLDIALTNADMDELLSENPKFYSFEAIIHTTFLRGGKTHPRAFTHVISEGRRDGAVSLPYFTPGQVVQALTDLLGSTNNPYAELSVGYAVQVAYASELRMDGCPWAERIVPIYVESSRPSLNDGLWTLVWTLPEVYRGQKIKQYGFIRPREGDGHNTGEIQDGEDPTDSDEADLSITYDIHDIKAFIHILVSQGRPAPSPIALEKLSGALSAAGFTLLTQQGLATLLNH